MKFNCGPTWEEEVEAKERWHKWFAWHPVRVGPRDCRWLEGVERKGKFYGGIGATYWCYEYRPAQPIKEVEK